MKPATLIDGLSEVIGDLRVDASNDRRRHAEDIDSFLARFLEDEFRHAELAALVSKLTIAVEALERKVDAQLALEMAEDIGLVGFHIQSQTEGEGVT